MALNHYAKGDVLDYTNTSGATITSGSPVLIGSLLAVALADIADDAAGAVAIAEVFEIRKATGAITQGAKVYWDADGNPVVGASGSGCLTTTADGNTYAGVAAVAAGNTDATVMVKLNA